MSSCTKIKSVRELSRITYHNTRSNTTRATKKSYNTKYINLRYFDAMYVASLVSLLEKYVFCNDTEVHWFFLLFFYFLLVSVSRTESPYV